jgi:hypothetical protein
MVLFKLAAKLNELIIDEFLLFDRSIIILKIKLFLVCNADEMNTQIDLFYRNVHSFHSYEKLFVVQ